MILIKQSVAGSDKKGDVIVRVEPLEQGNGLQLNITSRAMRKYGPHIESVVRGEIAKWRVTDAAITIADHGALDFALKARVETALRRAMHGEVK